MYIKFSESIFGAHRFVVNSAIVKPSSSVFTVYVLSTWIKSGIIFVHFRFRYTYNHDCCPETTRGEVTAVRRKDIIVDWPSSEVGRNSNQEDFHQLNAGRGKRFSPACCDQLCLETFKSCA